VKLPVISLWQPWCFWVACGWKTIETRTHARFARLEGGRIGIHAGLTWESGAVETVARPYLSAEQIAKTNGFEVVRGAGAIIATARVRAVRWLTAADSSAALIDCGTVHRFGLVLEEVRAIVPGIACKGRQGIFYVDVPAEVAA
jgi:hypothetical protein